MILKYSIKHIKTSRVFPQPTKKFQSNSEELHLPQSNTLIHPINRLNPKQKEIIVNIHTLTHILKYHQHHKSG
jgi:hypothetical protein